VASTQVPAVASQQVLGVVSPPVPVVGCLRVPAGDSRLVQEVVFPPARVAGCLLAREVAYLLAQGAVYQLVPEEAYQPAQAEASPRDLVADFPLGLAKLTPSNLAKVVMRYRGPREGLGPIAITDTLEGSGLVRGSNFFDETDAPYWIAFRIVGIGASRI
jgi:hypothetical protein